MLNNGSGNLMMRLSFIVRPLLATVSDPSSFLLA